MPGILSLNRAVRVLALLAFATLAGATVALAGGEKDTIKRSFDVEPGGTVYVDVDRGNVIVESIGGTRVHVEMERTVDRQDLDDMKRILARHEWEIEGDDEDVVIESRFDTRNLRRRNGDGFRLTVTIRVPAEYNVDFKTGAGNVTISDLSGFVEGKTGAGNITIGEINGDVEVLSGSGNVEVEAVTGSLEVLSGAGNIRLGFVGGEVEATTGAGEITARITDQLTEDVSLQTGAGDVTVYMGDDIGVDVDARASVGSASCEFGLRVRGKWMSKTFEGRINGGGPSLTIRAGVGNVSLLRL
jgi:putative adhesin